MKKKVIFTLMLAGLLVSACGFPVRYTTVRGTGNLISESRHAAGFDTVELEGVGTLIIEQGETEALEITAEENLMPYLESRVANGSLILGIEGSVNIQPTEEIVYRLEVKDLNRIETSGLGNVEIGKFQTGQLSITISGNGKVTIQNLTAKSLDMEISGLGDIELTGSVDEQSIEVSGAGNYKASDMQSDRTVVRISGSGSAEVWAIEKLEVEISGLGTVEYSGSPVIDSEISGAGKLVSTGN